MRDYTIGALSTSQTSSKVNTQPAMRFLTDHLGADQIALIREAQYA